MLTLYTVPTANGQRASVALEECGLEYRVRHVDFAKGEHRSEEVLELNPLGRMPFLVDAETNLNVYGSMAIARHAAMATGHLMPPAGRETEMEHWIGIVMTDLSPAFASQFHLGVLAPEPYTWGLEYYADVIRRVFALIDDHLATREFLVGDVYTLADVLLYPTAATSAARLEGGLEAWQALGRWRDRVAARPAVARGMTASGSL